MKTILALLVIGLALQSAGAALQCYSCTAQVNNRDCQKVQNCSHTDTYCWTSRVGAEPGLCGPALGGLAMVEKRRFGMKPWKSPMFKGPEEQQPQHSGP
ncbi:prostate stem cell antigen isoform X4 [Cavia porcellus]|uniref:prostate stem cell antigen isoform X4 n=1 Tax=Cavia porcellus TaxID=10141 RepID=UPI002FE01890